MNYKSAMILLTILSISFLGCIESKINTETTITPQIRTLQPSELVLSLADFPANYTINERSPRLKSDVSKEGLNLGWKDGYQVLYTKAGQSLFDITAVTQSISVYPKENLSKVIDLPRESDANFTSEELQCSGIGEKCKSWRITDKTETGLKSRIYMIEFIKMDIYEDIRIAGTAVDYELLKDLAKKAEGKIK